METFYLLPPYGIDILEHTFWEVLLGQEDFMRK